MKFLRTKKTLLIGFGLLFLLAACSSPQAAEEPEPAAEVETEIEAEPTQAEEIAEATESMVLFSFKFQSHSSRSYMHKKFYEGPHEVFAMK